ncbi:MAG: Zn-dependent hydrolase, partial [Candidatus Zixiibacteriota bacterium]
MKSIYLFIILAMAFGFSACNQSQNNNKQEQTEQESQPLSIKEMVNQYAVIDLKTDLSQLSDSQRKMIGELIEAAKIVDNIFWKQSFGNKNELFAKIKDADTTKFMEINYGPWDRLSGNQSFVNNIGKKPLGANFYPEDIKYFPFIQLPFQDKLSMYTLLARDKNRDLYTIPYHEAYKEEIAQVVDHMQKAADLAENQAFKDYLLKRIKALQTDEYYESDAAWVDMTDNLIDFTVGPFENEEDHFLYLKGAYEASVMIKDVEWTNKFASYMSFLPDLQKELPVESAYKSQKMGINSGIVVRNILYNGGYSNAGPKNIALTRPTDGKIQMEKGTKKLQFKNVTEAKFQKILYPIAELLMDSSQLKNVKSNSFFENNLFFEICNGMLLTQTIDDKGPVKESLNETYNVIKNLNNDVLRLFLIRKLNEKGILEESDINDNFAT